MSKLRMNNILRESIAERDGFVCQVTGKQAVDLHHIVYKSLGGNNTAYNLISLSREQHEIVHRNGKKWFKILFDIQKKRYPDLTREMMKK